MEKLISRFKWMMVCLGSAVILYSCAGTLTRPMTTEYRTGMDAAETMAKADAIKENCIFSFPVRQLMHKNLKAHLTAMGSQHTDEYRDGFTRGYKKYFIEFMDLYCDTFERHHK